MLEITNDLMGTNRERFVPCETLFDEFFFTNKISHFRMGTFSIAIFRAINLFLKINFLLISMIFCCL